jgi:ribosomal peptide maturation radical SAM protein 1
MLISPKLQPLRNKSVYLISMPFAPAIQPSIGLSLLQSALSEKGFDAKVRYFALDFYDKIGANLYNQLSNSEPNTVDLVAEWIFSGQLFQQSEEDVNQYIKQILLGENPRHGALHGKKTVEAEFINGILDTREKTSKFLDDCCDEILNSQPSIVGFTSVFQQHIASLALAKKIKEKAPQIMIVFGGANCEGKMGVQLLKQFNFVDSVVSGEGEVVFPEIVNRYLHNLSIEDLQGVSTQNNVAINTKNALSPTSMDELPIPLYRDYFNQLENIGGLVGESPRVPFETSRGCWWGEKHHCTFCGLNGGSMVFRSKSPERAISELIYLTKQNSGLAVSVVDNILDMKYFDNFIPNLVKQKLNLQLFYEVKSNLRKSQVAQLSNAGITLIQPGIESLSDNILKLMRKGVRALQNIQLLKWCKEYNITPIWNVLWGFPGESEEDYKMFENLVPKLIHLSPPGAAAMIRLDRFSPNFDTPNDFGISNIQPYPAYYYIYKDVPKEAINDLAYYFTFGTDENQYIIANYTRKLAVEIAIWQKSFEFSDLFFVDDDEFLTIYDFRSLYASPETQLSGLSRSLYLKCDQIQGLAQITTHFGVSQEIILNILKPLLEAGLMLQEDDSFLSLALSTKSYSPKATLNSRLQKLTEHSQRNFSNKSNKEVVA